MKYLVLIVILIGILIFFRLISLLFKRENIKKPDSEGIIDLEKDPNSEEYISKD